MRRLAALAVALLAPFPAPFPAHADTLIDNVDGLSIGTDGRINRFTALLIDREGRVAQVLKRGDRRPELVDYRLDGKGQVLMPGLIDSHVHVMGLGLSALMLDLSGAKSLDEALALVAAHAAENPDKPWLLGTGWNPESWVPGRMPTAAELDAVVADRPAWLLRVDGHAGWANSRALAAGGVTATARDPAGGRIERIAGTMRPAGVLVDAAMALVAGKVPAPRPEDRDLAFRKAQDRLLARGITAVADMGTTIEDWQTYRRAGDTGALTLRIMAFAEGIDAAVLIGGPGPTPWLYDDRLRLNGVKLVADGALGSRGALLKAPYADRPGERGLEMTAETALRNRMSRAAMDRFQIAVHAIGDEANARALSAFEELAETYKGDRRWRIEHARVVDPADWPRFGALGLVASMQPLGLISDRMVAESRLGPDRLIRAHAWASLAANGARLAFGSGAPAQAPDAFAGLALAISRQDENAQPFGGSQPQERLSREAALAAHTAGAAWAGFAEGRFGQLAKGERADFLLVDRDPTLASPAELRSMRIAQVWIAGRRVALPEAEAEPDPN